jgi:transcriptional regulator with XRE-family HTH domain
LKALGEAIKRQIILKGFPTMEVFAHENDIPKGTLSKILRGKVDPKLTTLFRIAKGLDMTVTDLFKSEPAETWVMEKPKGYKTKRKKRRK